MMSFADKEANMQVEMEGYWGKMKCNLFLNTKLEDESSTAASNDTQNTTINQELTTLFKALENGFKAEMEVVMKQNESMTFYRSNLTVGKLGGQFFIKNKNTLNLYYAVSTSGNQADEKPYQH